MDSDIKMRSRRRWRKGHVYIHEWAKPLAEPLTKPPIQVTHQGRNSSNARDRFLKVAIEAFNYVSQGVINKRLSVTFLKPSATLNTFCSSLLSLLFLTFFLSIKISNYSAHTTVWGSRR